MSAFAGILDGQSLWLAIEAMPGSLALRESVSGDVIALAGDLPEDQPAYRAIRVDLAGLPGDDEATYDVVLVPAGGRSPKRVWTDPLTGPPPAPARDGRTQYALRRDDEGMLQVRRSSLPSSAVLRRIEVVADGLELTLDGAGSTVVLVGEDGAVLATFPTSDTGDASTVLLSAAALPLGVVAKTRVLTVQDGNRRPIRRHANDLADPGRAVPLPHLYDGEHDDARLRLRWGPQANLTARLFCPGGDGA